MARPASSNPTQHRLSIEIHGAVQGVGFRPFVYRLATEMALTGWVINDTRGVFIEVEGPEATLHRFLERLPAEIPPRAIVQSLESRWLAPAGFACFEIRHSDSRGSKTVLVLPDIATCADCLAEVFDPADRRHGYPFTNCTNCGPRFTIVQALPYDRPNTTMRRFVMCPDCQAEYDNPLDRRFHAQPNACPVCGPRLTLYGSRGAGSTQPNAIAGGEAALMATADALRAGRIVAVKGLGGFHLMVDAANAQAIARLRQRKPRRDKPFALMVRDLDQAAQLCEVAPEAATVLSAPEAPIVLLPRRPDAPVAENVAPGNPTLGVMLPYTPLHHLLLRAVDRPIVATSGNLTDEPICTDEREAMQRLGHIADLFLVHDRPIERHVDDSVVWIIRGEVRLLRRARGYAPLPVMLARPAPTILAVGAHLKNTVALSIERQVFISQHIGDLETAEAMNAFERVIADFLRLYEVRPVAIAHDLHPDYLSTGWARATAGDRLSVISDRLSVISDRLSVTGDQLSGSGDQLSGSGDRSALVGGVRLVAVQHHHAHLASCLAENDVDGPALGVTWDGTGYGRDGTVWGGEFLLGDAADFQRVAHLRTFRLPGGDAAIKEPRRVALAMLWELYGDQVLDWEHLAPIATFSPTERRLLAQMLGKGLNTPLTSSAGRLFDGIASLIGLHQQVSFEGQDAMALEFAVDGEERGVYSLSVTASGSPGEGGEAWGNLGELEGTGRNSGELPLILDWQPLVEAVLADLRRNVSSGIIAARFHNALTEAVVTVAKAIGEPRVALSGGCFQNRILTGRTARRLRQAGFQVLLHRQVPPNDGGISLGQVAVAAARLSAGRGW